MAVERERRAAAAAARKAAQARDILAEAEAILSGTSPLADLITTRTTEDMIVEPLDAEEAETVLETEAEPELLKGEKVDETAVEEVAEPIETVEEVVAEAEAILSDQEEPAVAEMATGQESKTVTELEEEAEEMVTEEPKVEAEPVGFGDTYRTDWQEDFEFEDEDDRDRELERKKARRKKRRLVFDERLGEVVAERRRKRSRRTDDWYDFDEEM
jgi:hypothetical protein